jgi:hypothetical protein
MTKMSAEADELPIVDDEDIDTTTPQSKNETWTMPEPVFRKTSGRLRKESETPVDNGEAESSSSVSPDVVAHALTEPKPKSPTTKIVLVALAVIALAVFVIALVTIVYFLFLRW